MTYRRRSVLALAASAVAGRALTGPVFPLASADGTLPSSAPVSGFVTDVRTAGAVGDGKAVDTPAVNRAIELAASMGGGIVHFPAGTYRCHSIRLRSFIALSLAPGAVILAAEVPRGGTATGGYDAAESNAPFEQYQDFGHNHWHNSLIWGEGLHDIAILGSGLIWGKGLSRGDSDPDLPKEAAPGAANKAIALKNCRNVILEGFAILAAGHFGILATGVDNLAIRNVRIDTNRDGMNIDCCRNVRISGCSVNAPWDDGICLKSTFALGHAQPTENVTISDCYVTGGYRVGTLLDGTLRRFGIDPAERAQQPTGRIKFGTESNGGFRNIAITNCVFETSRGLALECVDGGVLEDISIANITMREVQGAPLFLRLGARLRAPAGTPTGAIRRIVIRGLVCDGPDSDMPSIICGIPGHSIEDVTISDVEVAQKGGSADHAMPDPPEREAAYPERRCSAACPHGGSTSAMPATSRSALRGWRRRRPMRGRRFGLSTWTAPISSGSTCRIATARHSC
ncbi:rhamnogalacturonidase [Rhodopila globiformis]|uniref:rhamnogalacturonidase n=1 Tax=Rhodopila globiformis TaxID=1071 RepID=UPI00195A7148|nr:glycoside hydrolase family 28 protein [Rhodopila globiformis]